MRIGIITDHPFEAPFGYSIRPRELSINLANLGSEVHVFSPVDKNLKLSDNLTIHGISSYQTPFIMRAHKLIRKVFKNPLVAPYLYRKRVLEALSRQLAESVYSKVKDYNIDVLQGEKEIASMAAIILGERLDIPVVADIHGLLAEEAVLYGLLKSHSEEYLESRAFVSKVLNKSSTIVVVSEYLKCYLIKNFDLDDKKISVVPNAGTFRGVVRPLRSTPRNIVYAGILEPWERVDLAVASMSYVLRIHGKAKFLVAGSGSLERNLIKLVHSLKLEDYVRFTGTISYEKIADFLAQGDIAVLPSTVDIVRKVACPIKLFDYLATGLPVVTVDGLWWSDFVMGNNVGLVADANPESFASAINDLLLDPDKINAMSQNAVKLVKEKYNWTEMAKKLLNIYQKIL
jgi:glycosyltransferase involved in cell wall biosynthesis